MMNRRLFLQTLALTAAAPRPALADGNNGSVAGFGKLLPDPEGVLDLPAGFSYTVISRVGEEMDDGLLVPGLHDGMAAFRGDGGTVRLVCNHEVSPAGQEISAFGRSQERLAVVHPDKIYDYGKGRTPGAGGTTTIEYDPVARERRRINLSLAGTEINCAGGPMPWGSWLSCEETFSDPGSGFERGGILHREKRHGYVFEVPAHATGLVEPVPLTALGRFEHEAAAADPVSGVIYLTEDRYESLLYRFLPNVAGRLRDGGRLQALAIVDRPRFDSRNWGKETLQPGQWLDAEWLDLDEPDVDTNDLRLRGREKGATAFARGEGLCYADGYFAFTCTIGGPQRLGQIFAYRPSPAEGTAAEAMQRGQLGLIAQSNADSLLMNPDNIALSPWGDLVVCEDTSRHCGMVGIRPDGVHYKLADNPYTSAELAGICFSPDGSIMFVNVQQRGLTLAITGPWSSPT